MHDFTRVYPALFEIFSSLQDAQRRLLLSPVDPSGATYLDLVSQWGEYVRLPWQPGEWGVQTLFAPHRIAVTRAGELLIEFFLRQVSQALNFMYDVLYS